MNFISQVEHMDAGHRSDKCLWKWGRGDGEENLSKGFFLRLFFIINKLFSNKLGVISYCFHFKIFSD